MKITQTNGNAKNGISGSRIRVWAEFKTGDVMVDEFTVPQRNGVRYCQVHQTGQYGRRYEQAVSAALDMESSGFDK